MKHRQQLDQPGSSRRRPDHASSRGFTLIELMIVVAVIAIIAAVAYPSYLEQMRKTRRADAQGALMELTQFMERAYTNCNAYNKAPPAPACGALALPFTQSPKDGATKYYDLSVVSDAESYTLTATRRAGVQASDSCGTMTINNIGAKTAAEAGCWK